jgi:hypothetical protein
MADQPSYAAVPDYARVQAMRATEDERNLKRFRAFSDLQFDKFAADKPNYTDPTYSNVLDRKEDGSRGKIFGNYDEEIDERRKRIEDYNASIDEKAKDKKSKGMGKKIYSGDMPGDKDRYLLANTERYYLHDLNYYKDLEAYGNKAKQLFAQTGNPKYKEMADKIFGVEGPDGTLSGGQLAQVSRGIQGTILKSLASALESGSTYAASELMHHYSRGMGSGLQFVATGRRDNVGNKTYDVYGADNRILQEGLSARHITDFLTRGESNVFTTLMDAQAAEATKNQAALQKQELANQGAANVANIRTDVQRRALDQANDIKAQNTANTMGSTVSAFIDTKTGKSIDDATKIVAARNLWLGVYNEGLKNGYNPSQAKAMAENAVSQQFNLYATYKPISSKIEEWDIKSLFNNAVDATRGSNTNTGTNTGKNTGTNTGGTTTGDSSKNNLGGVDPNNPKYGSSSDPIAQAVNFARYMINQERALSRIKEIQKNAPTNVDSTDPETRQRLQELQNIYSGLGSDPLTGLPQPVDQQ